MHTYRCAHCDRFLFRALAPHGGMVELICPDRRCRKNQRVTLIDESRDERCTVVAEEREQERRAS